MSKAPRPARADGEATRGRILEAAGRLIAASGFADTTSKVIAAEAGADLASINYHFGSRGGLYEAVLAEAHRELISVDTLRRIAALDEPPEDKLRRIISGLVEAATSHEGWPARVLGRELLLPSVHIRVLRETELPPKLAIVLGVLSEITGIPPGDPALFRCFISVAAPCAMLVVAGRSLSILGEDFIDMPREVLVRHLHGFSMAGLAAVGREYRQSKDAAPADQAGDGTPPAG